MRTVRLHDVIQPERDLVIRTITLVAYSGTWRQALAARTACAIIAAGASMCSSCRQSGCSGHLDAPPYPLPHISLLHPPGLRQEAAHTMSCGNFPSPMQAVRAIANITSISRQAAGAPRRRMQTFMQYVQPVGCNHFPLKTMGPV